ncbi:MAG TPA: DUF305 domain-containing protein [Arthrobacter sp.]|jgi:uncharacterized protein (DUF305 family)
MMNKKFVTFPAAALAAALALAGCSTGSSTASTSTSSGSSMSGMDHGSGMMSGGTPSANASAAADHNAADVTFTQGMIPHHAQAVEMSEMMLTKQDIPAEVRALATRIRAAQGPEIETMSGWLKSWNEPQMPSGHSMEGMMGEDDLKMLSSSQGTEAAKLFLNQMIAHHQGAVTMAKTENTTGKSADAITLSGAIVSAQVAEIEEMRKLMAAL